MSTTADRELAIPDPGDPGQVPRFLGPFVDAVARVKATVHHKLLAGFLLIALLLLSMGVVCVVVLERIDSQVVRLTLLSNQVNQARERIYEVTAQSHYRAMALLTGPTDPYWTDKISAAKAEFDTNLAEIRTYAIGSPPETFDRIASDNEVYRVDSGGVTKLFEAGLIQRAIHAHIAKEHTQSHVLEAELNDLIATSRAVFLAETDSFARNRRLLTGVVAAISGLSLLAALALGAILSWSLIRPVRRVDSALARIANGDFAVRVSVPNRDEFGSLATNLNLTAGRLSGAYRDLETLNTNLQETVDTKVTELERMSRLKRYLSPQLAASIIQGDGDLDLGSRRKYLTTFFSDVRGFTTASERMEPDELIAQLNDYLSQMTEIVFRHGGTLDKYVGDAVMVFFGDPVWQDDHAERAVRMAFEMRERMRSMQNEWAARYNEAFQVGVGITTGWVTVGDIGSEARSDYTVLGNEVNLASRLSDNATAGQILVTEPTLEAVGDLVHAAPVEGIDLKGVSRDVAIFEINPKVAVTA
jgi:class 3 adenylate cyclase/HAMP domain-containing protein